MDPEEVLKKIGKLHATGEDPLLLICVEASFLDILPQNADNWEDTRAFLQQIVEILYDYIKEENNRDSKILDFHQPDEMKKLLDLSIPDKPMNLEQIINVRIIFCFLGPHGRGNGAAPSS